MEQTRTSKINGGVNGLIKTKERKESRKNKKRSERKKRKGKKALWKERIKCKGTNGHRRSIKD